jgi:hypothetical protein
MSRLFCTPSHKSGQHIQFKMTNKCPRALGGLTLENPMPPTTCLSSAISNTSTPNRPLLTMTRSIDRVPARRVAAAKPFQRGASHNPLKGPVPPGLAAPLRAGTPFPTPSPFSPTRSHCKVGHLATANSQHHAPSPFTVDSIRAEFNRAHGGTVAFLIPGRIPPPPPPTTRPGTQDIPRKPRPRGPRAAATPKPRCSSPWAEPSSACSSAWPPVWLPFC